MKILDSLNTFSCEEFHKEPIMTKSRDYKDDLAMAIAILPMVLVFPLISSWFHRGIVCSPVRVDIAR